jgi:hypothetical protein
MSISVQGVTTGFEITNRTNGAVIQVLIGTADPSIGAGLVAPVGSVYYRQNGTEGSQYTKVGAADTAWDIQTTGTFGKWRENVKVLTESNTTNDWSNVATGTTLSTLLPFDDDDTVSLVIGDFVAGDTVLFKGTTDRIYTIYDDGGTLKVSQDTDDIDPLTEGDTFITKFDLADVNNGENSAIYNFNGSDLVKIGDVDWALATGINLSSGYAGTTNGTPAADDTVEKAIGNLDANQRDLTTLSGEAQGAVDHGTFTGSTIPDSSNTHEALQALETAVELVAPPVTGTVAGIGNSFTLVDSVVVDDVRRAVWEIAAQGVTVKTKVYGSRISAIHDGINGGADAANVDDNELDVLEIPGQKIAGIEFRVVLSGAAGAQVMVLEAKATEVNGMDVRFERHVTMAL